MQKLHKVFEKIFHTDLGYVLDLGDQKEIHEISLNDFQTLIDAVVAAKMDAKHQTERGFFEGDMRIFVGSRLNPIIIRHRNYKTGGFRIFLKRSSH